MILLRAPPTRIDVQPRRAALEPGELPKARYILTTRGYERLKKELEELQHKRGQVASHIRLAKSYGDLNENFEYHEAKREQGFLESRILELREILPNARVISPAEVHTHTIGFGSVVRVRDLRLNQEWELRLLGPLEADPEDDRISYESPLGAALLGKKIGDIVEARVPVGMVRYEIKGIRAYDE
ncbi:MAG: transcription elongation factor GreA [Armatimonadetes bacterium]|nr:transcription elongation factor GreA [Armatimonadota bacterium]